MRARARCGSTLIALGMVLLGHGGCWGQNDATAATDTARIAPRSLEQVAKDADEAKLAGNNAWMLTSLRWCCS